MRNYILNLCKPPPPPPIVYEISSDDDEDYNAEVVHNTKTTTRRRRRKTIFNDSALQVKVEDYKYVFDDDTEQPNYNQLLERRLTLTSDADMELFMNAVNCSTLEEKPPRYETPTSDCRGLVFLQKHIVF